MNISNLDLNLLRVLDALLIERSTTKAAQRVNLSQPAVSASLSRLRDALQDPLFERKGRCLEPTEFALALEPELRSVLSKIEEMLSTNNSFDPKQCKQNFRIAASDYFADYLMPLLINRFRKEAPNARLQITPLDAQDHLNSLERFKTDLIIFLSLPVPGWMRAKDAFISPFRVIARKDHSDLKTAGITPEMIIPMDLYCGLEHALYSPSGDIKTWVDSEIEKLDRKRRISASTSTFHSLSKVVESSDLLATVPALTAYKMADHFELDVYKHPLVDPTSNLMMAWHYRNNNKPEQKWFRSLVEDELATLQAINDRYCNKDGNDSAA